MKIFVALLFPLWVVVQAIPPNKMPIHNNKHLNLLTMPQPVPKTIAPMLTLKERINLSMVAKQNNLFRNGLQLYDVLSESAGFGANLLRHCNSDEADFRAALRDITEFIAFIKAELTKTKDENMLDRLSEFESVADYFRNLSGDMSKCATRLNSYELALHQIDYETLITFKNHNPPFKRFFPPSGFFRLSDPTEEQLKESITAVGFTDNEAERERLVLQAIVDMMLSLSRMDEKLFVYLDSCRAVGDDETSNFACERNDGQTLKILNYLNSRKFAVRRFSRETVKKTPIMDNVVPDNQAIYFFEVSDKVDGSKKFSKRETDINELTKKFFQAHGDFYDFGFAAVSNLILRNSRDWVRSINDLKLIAKNRCMSDLLYFFAPLQWKWSDFWYGAHDVYENAKTIALNCIKSNTCDAQEEIDAEVLVEIFCLPPSIAMDELQTVLESDRLWDRVIRNTGAILT